VPSRRRARSALGIGAVALTALLCTAALARVGGDDARLPADSAATAHSIAPEEHPAATAKRDAAHARLTAATLGDELAWPLHGDVTGSFNEPRYGHMHEGIDIPMPAGTPIEAAGSGEVVMREVQDGYGKYTCIAHETITTCYGHQSRFGTKLGAEVRQGEVIGYVGNTGNSGWIHLHFEVRRGTEPWGKPLNPKRFLPPAS
jgi:murein DD-endopeptidase MepM/ murein hydrolase activator NlpD